MAGRKLTELTTTESLSSNDLVYVVDIDAAAGSKSKGITKANLAAQMGTSVASSEPVENEYADITALLADQGNQTTAFLQYVIDASADPNDPFAGMDPKKVSMDDLLDSYVDRVLALLGQHPSRTWEDIR